MPTSAYLKPTALVTTDGLGNDIKLPAECACSRLQAPNTDPPQLRRLPQPASSSANPNPHNPVVRALYMALDDSATKGVSPPASRYSKVSDGTLVPSPCPSRFRASR